MLDPVRDQLRLHPELRVQIVAAQGAIATKRSEATKWYLVDGGIEIDRIVTAISAAVVTHDELQIEVVGATCEATPTPAPVVKHPPPAHKSNDSMVADASDLANLLAGGEPTPAPRPATPTPVALPKTPPTSVRIGNDDVGFRDDSLVVHASSGFSGLPLALATIRAATVNHHDDELQQAAKPAASTSAQSVALDAKQMRALSRCYRKAIAFDPSTSNRVELAFGLDPTGRVLSPVAITDTAVLDSCIAQVMARWRFPAVKLKSPSHVFLSLTLAPG
jgi:hypothetical protein